MQDAIYRAVDDGIDVYYCNTDSLLIKREDLSRIRIPLGDKLGEFHMEYEMKKFICLSAKRYVRVFHDDTFQNAFGKRDVEWCEEEYSRVEIRTVDLGHGLGVGGSVITSPIIITSTITFTRVDSVGEIGIGDGCIGDGGLVGNSGSGK
jgi:hypothetical protein